MAGHDVLYGEDVGSNYQAQQTMLSKHFSEQTARVAAVKLKRVHNPKPASGQAQLPERSLIVYDYLFTPLSYSKTGNRLKDRNGDTRTCLEG